MKVLLIGPVPPPHGGVSVHVAGIHRGLTEAGVPCRVLDTREVRSVIPLLRYAWSGWTLHLHTNGHNWKSWVLALICGLAGQLGPGCVLTLHSGMAPDYLEKRSSWRRRLARCACRLYLRVICVSSAIQAAVISAGVAVGATEVLPASMPIEAPSALGRPGGPPYELQVEMGGAEGVSLCAWIEARRPLFSTALFFRPEYGFDVLVAALHGLAKRYPSLGCVVMGSGEERGDAERLLRESGLEDRVLLIGDVDHAQCLAFMAASDVFLRTTRQDGDSISVREALSLGLPVVASRVGARPDGVTLFAPGNAEDLMSKVELALTMKRGAAAPVAGCFDRLMEIYDGAPGKAGRYDAARAGA